MNAYFITCQSSRKRLITDDTMSEAIETFIRLEKMVSPPSFVGAYTKIYTVKNLDNGEEVKCMKDSITNEIRVIEAISKAKSPKINPWGGKIVSTSKEIMDAIGNPKTTLVTKVTNLDGDHVTLHMSLKDESGNLLIDYGARMLRKDWNLELTNLEYLYAKNEGD